MSLKISKKISEIRNSNKLTQEDLAELLGVARQTVSNWENDKCYPDIETIILISDKFNISLDILLKEDKEMVKAIDKSVRVNKINKKIFIILLILFLVLCFFGYKLYLYNIYNVYSDLEFNAQELNVSVDRSIANTTFADMHIFIPEEYTEDINNEYIYELNNENAISLYKYNSLSFISERLSEKRNIDYEKIYEKYNISNELDLINYFEENTNKSKNIFQSKETMQINYLANSYINTKFALKDEYYYLEGDLKGIVESEKYRYLVTIFNEDESYIISLNKDIYSYEDVINTLKTIYFE